MSEPTCIKCGHSRNDPRRRGSDKFSSFCVKGCGCECVFPEPVPATLPDVEAALAETRKMFPGRQIVVSVRDCGNESTTLRNTTLEYSVQIGLNGQDFNADSLLEVMQKVREYKEQSHE